MRREGEGGRRRKEGGTDQGRSRREGGGKRSGGRREGRDQEGHHVYRVNRCVTCTS